MRSLLELKDQFLCWPEREERAEISSRILVEFGFLNCVGIMDETLIFLDEAPVQYYRVLLKENKICAFSLSCV